MPTFSQVKESHPGSLTVLLDRRGQILQESRISYKEYRYPWVELEKLPKNIGEELIAIEDHRFWEHSGIDYVSIVSALKLYLTNGK